MENQFKITEKVIETYEKLDDYGKEILEGIFGKEAFSTNIKDKIKTFMDAVEMLGNNNQTVKDYYDIANISNAVDIIALAKLRIIADALNDGWKPNFDKDEVRYFTSFVMYSEEEYEELKEDKKKECKMICRKNEKTIYLLVENKWSIWNVSESHKIALKSKELAEYFGIQFFDIWKDYMFG